MLYNEDLTLDWEDDDSSSNKRVFTNREKFKKILKKAVEDPQDINERRVKFFFGAGGQGKSALKDDFFIKEFLTNSENDNFLFSDKVDFELNVNTRIPENALLAIAEDLIEKGNIPLPAFCLGFLRYRMLSHSEKNITETYPYLLKTKFSSNDVANEVLNIIVDSALTLIEAGSVIIPGIGHVTKKATEFGNRKIVDWLRMKGTKKVLGDIDELNKHQLSKRLPLLLAYDINMFLKKQQEIKTFNKRKRIVIIFDGYEKLWNDEQNSITDKEAWIRSLVAKMPGVLFVFFGRDKLSWGEENELFNEFIEQFEVKGLEDKYAQEFLELSGIVEENIRTQIIKSAKNKLDSENLSLPFYLDLQKETYFKIKNQGKEPVENDFKKTNEKLINHFLEHLNPQIEKAIKILCLAPYIDDEILAVYVKAGLIPPFTISLKSLKRHSFIKFENDKAAIHGLMKECVTTQYKEDYFAEYLSVNETLFAYFNSKLDLENKIDEINLGEHIVRASLHKEIYDKKNYFIWANECAIALKEKNCNESLIYVLQRADYFFVNQNLEQESENKVIILKKYFTYEVIERQFLLSDNYHNLLDYINAKKYISLAYNIVEKIIEISIKSDEELSSLNKNILQLELEILEKYSEILVSLDEYEQAQNIFFKIYSIKNKYSFLVSNELIYANFLYAIGMFEMSEPILFNNFILWREKLSREDSIENKQFLGYSLNRLANCIRSQGRFDEALKYAKLSAENILEVHGENDKNYVIALSRIAQSLVLLKGDHNEIKKIFDLVFDILKNNFNDDNVLFGHYYNDLANFYISNNQLKIGFEYFELGQTILSKKLGKHSRSILTTNFEMAFIINDNHKKKQLSEPEYVNFLSDFENLILTELNICKIRFGIFNPILHKGMAIVAQSEYEKGNWEKSLELENKKNEFVRILEQKTSIRAYCFEQNKVFKNKSFLVDKLRNLMSLPQNDGLINITKIILPFYNNFSLYKILYKNTNQLVIRYAFSDIKDAFLLDYKNTSIYKVSKLDGNFNKANIFDYACFFFDLVRGFHGFYHIIKEPENIPWRVDIEISEHYKKIITSNVLSHAIVEIENDNFILKDVFVLFQNSIFLTDIIVDKIGICKIQNEKLCFFTRMGQMFLEREKDENGNTTYLDIKKNILDLDSINEKLFSKIDACRDPFYDNN
ncbi:tetratricopeptide repeat protein [Flavivirga sp. 57AJ16]|uniref:tetratricopeptide repeat protein n=1 Tax=Flavivirga sp. 57AJ16 TaxID=3025307 RepID=UPI0023669EF8|nr:tetratricopeptide repeat protein [Flavivirga sp. 57AJ16]MDD7885063.1 tetratricopeptide repeat protein [Flavivirga sp. 57AJ16]